MPIVEEELAQHSEDGTIGADYLSMMSSNEAGASLLGAVGLDSSRLPLL